MVGIFRRYRYSPPLPRRRMVPGVTAPVVPGEIPRKPINVAILMALVLRKILHERQTRTPPLLGVRQPGAPRLLVARILMERHRRIMFERVARRLPPVGVAPVVVGATPFLLRAPAVRRPGVERVAQRVSVPGIAAPAAVGATPILLRRPAVRRPTHLRVAARPIVMAGAVGFVIVCTDGVWSATISFLPCDDFRITIDGPAADQVKVSTTMELEE